MTLGREETVEQTAEPQPDGPTTGGDAAAWPHEKGRSARLWEAFRRQPVLNGALAVLCVAATVLAVLAVGPASQSGGQTTRTTTVKRGVVQSTVSGSGSIESASELNLGFKTGGTVTHIYVREGEEVARGQLIATLDPQSAEVSLEQAKATLKSAEATLAQLEVNEGESTSSGSSANPTASAASTSHTVASTASAGGQGPSENTQTTQAPTTTTPTTTTTQPAKEPTTSSGSGSKPTTTKTTTGTGETAAPSQSTSEGSGRSSSKQSAATREANLASAQATVQSDKLSLESAEKSVQNTKLYAPESGTIVSLSGEVGETVTGTGTTRAQSSASNSSSSSGTGRTGSSSSAGGGSSTPSSGSEGSSSAFAVLNNLESLQLVVGLSESEVGQVHVGQIATVTVEALSGRKVAARVVKIGQVPSSSGSGAVSYDVTFRLDQSAAGLKVGMSATAEVVVEQAEGLNVPTSTIKGGTVTVVRNGKHVTQTVTTGLAGDSSTIVLSGLKAGEEVLQTVTTGSGSSSLGSRGSSRLGGLGGGLGGGGGGFPSGGGFPAGGPPG